MKFRFKGLLGISSLLAICLSGCAIYRYPGQPGMKTDDMARIDFEDFQYGGLWTYEVQYDNTRGGRGVSAIVSYFYPGAKTNTSNVRMNSEGTLFRHEHQLKGAQIQAISIPKLNQVIMPRDSQVWLFLGYSRSMNEIDSYNLAEDNIFVRHNWANQPISTGALAWMKAQQKLLSLGQIDWKGNVVYTIESLDVSGKVFTPPTPVRVESNIFGSTANIAVTEELKSSLVNFIHANFPQGYDGTVQIHLSGAGDAIPFDVSVHTPTTFEQAGGTIIRNATKEYLEQTLASIKANK